VCCVRKLYDEIIKCVIKQCTLQLCKNFVCRNILARAHLKTFFQLEDKTDVFVT